MQTNVYVARVQGNMHNKTIARQYRTNEAHLKSFQLQPQGLFPRCTRCRWNTQLKCAAGSNANMNGFGLGPQPVREFDRRLRFDWFGVPLVDFPTCLSVESRCSCPATYWMPATAPSHLEQQTYKAGVGVGEDESKHKSSGQRMLQTFARVHKPSMQYMHQSRMRHEHSLSSRLQGET